jgi:hypothetical protein
LEHISGLRNTTEKRRERMTEVFRRYPEATPEEARKGSARCAVSHPDAGGPCDRPAVGEVWSIPFCEAHGREAEAAARLEAAEETGRELQILADAEAERLHRCAHVLEALRAASVPGLDAFHDREHEAAAREAYPPADLEDRTDPDTLAFDYERNYDGDGPHDWWSEARELIVRFMREAHGAGLAFLLEDLEALRERATVQELLAERDWEIRYAAPRMAERASELRRHPHTETLARVNGRLAAASALLETVPDEGFPDYWKASEKIAEAGMMVATAERRRREAEEPAGPEGGEDV